ncbi:MAG: hypothetical protein M3Y69_03705 [Verrucomicrobiota bacterium]|nr:hypothetical protein [Verrucomicrobiota bacterium]
MKHLSLGAAMAEGTRHKLWASRNKVFELRAELEAMLLGELKQAHQRLRFTAKQIGFFGEELTVAANE